MKIVKIIFSFLLCAGLLHTTFASNVGSINVVDDKHIDVNFSQDVNLSTGVINADIKILKDINVSFAKKDFNDSNKIILSLGDTLLPDTNYTLISIFGVDGSIDFRTDAILENSEKKNSEMVSGQGIVRVVISDPSVLELYFNQPISEEEFEFKLLNEIPVNNITSMGGSKLTVNMNESLEINNNYMAMIITLMNNVGSELLLDESFLDFSTNSDLMSTQAVQSIVEVAPEIVEEEQGNLEDVALNSAVTSETGPTTWILIFLTLIISGFLFMGKRIGKI